MYLWQNWLVKRYFRNEMSYIEAEFARLESLQREVQEEITSFRGSDRLDRDLVHDRATRSNSSAANRP